MRLLFAAYDQTTGIFEHLNFSSFEFYGNLYPLSNA